jgi:Thrombospondin type 3 repeat
VAALSFYSQGSRKGLGVYRACLGVPVSYHGAHGRGFLSTIPVPKRVRNILSVSLQSTVVEWQPLGINHFLEDMMTTKSMLSVLVVATVTRSARSDDVLQGHDLFLTKPGTTISFASDPIPASFFVSGSAAFNGEVNLQGVPMGSYLGVGTGDMDTIVERLQDAVLPLPYPSSDAVDIELVALSLESVDPVQIDEGDAIRDWHLLVTLSPSTPSTGTMTIMHQTTDGGDFDTSFDVNAFLTFTRECDGEIRTLDIGAGGVSFTLSATNVPWNHTPSPGFPEFPPLTTNLFPVGVVEHDATGAAHHVVESSNGLLPNDQAFYVAGPHQNGFGLHKVTPFGQELIMSIPPYPFGFHRIAFGPTGLLYGLKTSENIIRSLDLETGVETEVCTIPAFGQFTTSSETGEFAINGGDGRLYHLDANCNVIESCDWNFGGFGIAFSPAGDVIVATHFIPAGGNGTLKADFSTDPCGAEVLGVDSPRNSMVISSDGKLFDLDSFGSTITQRCWLDPSPCFYGIGGTIPGVSIPTGITLPTSSLAIGPCFDPLIPDVDDDGVADTADNCVSVANACQFDSDTNGVGDCCDTNWVGWSDGDVDAVHDDCDNCPAVPNPDQADTNNNGIGDACEFVPTVSEWGIIVMTLLVITSGTLVFARRRVVAG